MALSPDIERVALLGWRLYPASSRSKAGCIKQGADRATHDLDQLEEWAREFPGCNWRVVMQGSGIWALDVDRPGAEHAADGFAALQALIAKHGMLPPRPTTRSPSGGCALFWRDAKHPVRGKTGWPEPGLDPRAGRLTVTIPPSCHHRTKAPYRWMVAPWELAPPIAPAWLLRAVAPPPEPPKPKFHITPTSDRALRRLYRAVDCICTAQPGTRNDTLNAACYGVARYVAAGLLSERQAVGMLHAAGRQAAIPEPEVRATISSALAAGRRNPIGVFHGR